MAEGKIIPSTKFGSEATWHAKSFTAALLLLRGGRKCLETAIEKVANTYSDEGESSTSNVS